MRAKIKSQVAQASAYLPELARTMEHIVDSGYVIIGSPDEVAEQLRDVATRLHVGHLMPNLQFGNMRTDLVRYNTELFAQKVMPQIKDLFDNEWEDHWWPTGMRRGKPVVPAPIRAAEGVMA